MKEHIFKDPERCSRVIKGYKKSNIEKYDVNQDIDYFAEKLINVMKKAGIHFDVENAKRKDSFEAAMRLKKVRKVTRPRSGLPIKMIQKYIEVKY